VVGDLRMRNLADPPDRIVYMPLRQGGFFGVFSVFIRTHDPQSAAAVVRGKLREIDAALPAYDIRPMQDWVDNNSGAARMRTWAIALLAAVALALGMIGIYGVLAYLVTLRSHEFGVRLALGAKPGDVLCMVLGKGLALAAAGIALGISAAVVLTRTLDTLLVGVRPRDPLTFAGVAAVLLCAALLACLIPARRAANADPVVTLRGE
jgi:ABC-type antimicrobial peptide transport system permease subunit